MTTNYELISEHGNQISVVSGFLKQAVDCAKETSKETGLIIDVFLPDGRRVYSAFPDAEDL